MSEFKSKKKKLRGENKSIDSSLKVSTDISSGLKPKTERPEDTKTVVKTGYAKKGDLIATVHPAVAGKEGKNVLGKTIPPKEVKQLRLVAGENVRVERGIQFFMNTTGTVQVLRDQFDTFYIRCNPYRDGAFRISISDDAMRAILTVTPSVGGGRAVTVEDVVSECERIGVKFGLDEEKIRDATARAQLERMAVTDVCIAQGEKPVHGRDGKIELKVVRASGSTFTLRDDGSVDYKDHDIVTNVKESQILAVVTREQEGVRDGHDVRGQVFTAQRGKLIELQLGKNVRAEDKVDTIEYYAGINGQLIFDGKMLSVEPVLMISGDVGPKTGNINFNGTVHVKGSIKDTFNVISKKDIIVEGNIGNSIVRADGNIIVYNGVVGKGKGSIHAGGNVRVKFAENSNIHSGGDIHIQRAALNCKLVSGGKIVSLQEKGQIIGGDIRARKGIEVKILGNESELPIEVHVGTDFFLEDRLEEIGRKIQIYETALQKIALLLDKLNKVSEDPEQLSDNLKKIYAETKKKGTIAKIAINELIKKQSQLLTELEKKFEAEILVRDTMHRGTKIYFGNSVFEPEGTATRVRIYYDKSFDRIMMVRLV